MTPIPRPAAPAPAALPTGPALAALQADWPLLSALLDEALERPADERPAWLAALRGRPDLDPGLVDRLVALLQNTEVAASFLEELPPVPSVQAEAAMADGPQPGDLVGPWRVLRLLGEGGMGRVFLAERADGGLKRQVALKLPRVSWQGGLAQRLQRERDVLVRLDHPHIAGLYDAGVDETGRPWLALAYIDGVPIDRHCREHALPLRDRVGLVCQIGQALAFAHARLVTHRDIKPSNVLVGRDDGVHLLDFGIAGLLAPDAEPASTLTAHLGRPVTLQYASPEQVAGAPTGTASDVFSLGVLAIELLTGCLPYRQRRGSRAELEEAVLSAEELPRASSLVPRSELSRALRGDLDAVLAQAVRKQPGQRYATMDAFVDDLQRWLEGRPVRARAIGPAELAWRWTKRHAMATGAVVGVLSLLLLATGVSLHQAGKARDEAARARHEAQRAQAVQGLLLDIFRVNSIHQPDPLKAQQTTVRELVDVAAQRVNQVLREAPESQVQVLGALGDLYVEMGLAQPALKLQRERWQIAQRVLPADDVERADAALALAARLYDGGGREEARRLLDEAGRVLDQAGAPGLRLRGQLHLLHAMFHRYENLPQALHHVEQALQAFEAHDPRARRRGSAFYIAGTLQALSGRAAETLATLEQGQQVARELYPDVPSARFSVISDLAEYRRRAGQWAAAEADSTEALALAEKAFGPLHRTTLVVLAGRAEQLLDTGRTGEALALHRALQQRAASRVPPFEPWWLEHATYLTQRRMNTLGRPDLLEPVLRTTITRLQRDLPKAGATAERMRLLAEGLVLRGQTAEAATWLQQAQAQWRRYAGDLPTPAVDRRWANTSALLLLADGRAAQALQTLPDVEVNAGSAPTVATQLLLRSEALRREGRADEALAAADRALTAARGLPLGWGRPDAEPDAWLVKGLAHRALGQAAESERALRQALRLREALDVSPSLHAGRLKALLAGLDCGLVGGQDPRCYRPAATRHPVPG